MERRRQERHGLTLTDAMEKFQASYFHQIFDRSKPDLAALDRDPAVPATLRTHPDPIGLRSALMAGLAVTVLPGVAAAAPLMNVGARPGLPTLGALPVSIYVASTPARPPEKTLVACLATELGRED